MSDTWRIAVLNEMLKLITDQWIAVDGKRLQIRTHLSTDYNAEEYPWPVNGNPSAPDEYGSGAEFDIVSEGDMPTDYRYRIELIVT